MLFLMLLSLAVGLALSLWRSALPSVGF
jgi:hypothetical protein